MTASSATSRRSRSRSCPGRSRRRTPTGSRRCDAARRGARRAGRRRGLGAPDRAGSTRRNRRACGTVPTFLMDFDLSEEQLLIQRTARDVAERVLAPRAAARDVSYEFPLAELRELGRLGLLGIAVPEALGGAA